MSVRAKFRFTKYETEMHSQEKRDANNQTVNGDDGRAVYESVEKRTLIFQPVYANNDPNHENSRFWRYSPSGELRLGTVNPEAWSQFELGKEYYLDFSAAP